MKNTKQNTVLRFFTYYDEKGKEFVGVCLDLGIVKSGENPYFVEKDVVDAAMGYVEAVCKEHLPDTLLQQKPPQEYIDRFERFIQTTTTQRIPKHLGFNLDEARTFIRTFPEVCLAA